jgi:hypothetical protein
MTLFDPVVFCGQIVLAVLLIASKVTYHSHRVLRIVVAGASALCGCIAGWIVAQWVVGMITPVTSRVAHASFGSSPDPVAPVLVAMCELCGGFAAALSLPGLLNRFVDAVIRKDGPRLSIAGATFRRGNRRT